MPQKKSALVPIPDEVGRLYDRFTSPRLMPSGDNLHVGYWDNPDSEIPLDEATDRLTDLMTEKLKVRAGNHVLDIGCGIGGPGVRIARLTGARVTGISVSQEQIRLANCLAASAGVAERVVFQWANAMKLPFPAQSFDAAIALESFFHMPDRGHVLAQICRSLRPGGRLALTDSFERAPIPVAKQPTVDRFYNFSMATMVQAEDYPPLLRHAGLWFEEILDISEQTLRNSYIWWSWWTKHHNLDQGDEMAADRLDVEDLIDIPELGYLMVVAKRPEK
ncbi:MAG: methyltransferase domain-containing protein [Pseudonocardiales bacterium]|nr:methyltransferase domain-containing protein [Pseudonocardiales bacterium]